MATEKTCEISILIIQSITATRCSVTTFQKVLRVNLLQAYILLACWPKSLWSWDELTYSSWDLQTTGLKERRTRLSQKRSPDHIWCQQVCSGSCRHTPFPQAPPPPADSLPPTPKAPLKTFPFETFWLCLDRKDGLWDMSPPSSQAAGFLNKVTFPFPPSLVLLLIFKQWAAEPEFRTSSLSGNTFSQRE